MSDSTSTPSPTSGFPSDRDDLPEDLDLSFDGAEDILRSWRKGMRPEPDLAVSEWADAHRWLSSRGAAEPGRYRGGSGNLNRWDRWIFRATAA